jgi:hypothetical protein
MLAALIGASMICPAAAREAPGLKRHDDKLQKMVRQVEGVVGR